MAGKTDIAVIGMACRFPGASGHEAFWENLKAGISSIEVVPGNRWNWENYWGDPQTEKNKSNSKWGGFLKEVDCFDNDFFGLSATEVERMDPQQRIMLELTWSCMEDAGIRPAALSGTKAGVFVGVFNFDYKELQERSGQFAIEAHHSTGTASAIIANRISYYYNLKGPSFPIDTACSSSLSALHAAVQSLLQGECSVAVAGGINLLLTPTRHISFSKTGMLSSTGACKTFDDSADGYVRGEGAGLVLLKPLEQALADNDHIYGVIKGCAVNHGGKTYSLTYPSQEAQQAVILQAQQMAGVTPDSISYVEAHGTGTPKGDPIEFQALTNAFQSGITNDKKNYCGLGSVKTNIGHLEAAAGIAGVIKVLKSMQHQQLPGLQNFQKLNHRIGLEQAPFYLVTQLREWAPMYDAQDNVLPRRAGVSSFGFGGTNAHVILEEAPVAQAVHVEGTSPLYYMICLSAKTNNNLLQKTKDLLAWLKENNTRVEISNVCRTLATGREHFQKRTVLIVENIEALTEKLEALINNEKNEGCFTNITADKKEDQLHHLFIEMGGHITTTLNDPAIDQEAFYNKLAVLAELYIKGYNPDWEQRWFGSHGRRISMPAYPFTRTSFWLPDIQTPEDRTNPAIGNGASMLHPLLGSNISDFDGQKFKTRLTGKEFFIKDHVVKGKQLLPAVAYLEMIRAAIMGSVNAGDVEAAVLCLQNIIWAKPVVVESKAVDVHVSLFEEEDGVIAFDVLPDTAVDNEIVYSQGIAGFEILNEPANIHIPEYIRANNRQVWNKEQCYGALTQMGFTYGPGHQSVATVYAGQQQQYLAQLVLPAVIADTAKAYFLHPSILDGALQAALLAEAMGEQPSQRLYLPFALDRIEMIAPCTSDMWAVIQVPAGSTQGPVKRLDIDLYDGEGKLCVRMQGVCFKLLEEEKSAANFLLFTPQWQEEPVHAQSAVDAYATRLLVVCEPGHLFNETVLQSALPNARILLLQGAAEDPAQRFSNYTRKLFEEIQALIKQKLQGEVLLQVVICKPEAADLLRGLSGLLKTLAIEYPAIKGQLIEIGKEDDLITIIKENEASEDVLIRYANGSRQIAGWKELPAPPTIEMPWKEGGVYLITGGAGGLGLIVANEIVSKTKHVSLILTGRSILSEAGNERLQALRSTGARVAYHPLDVSDKRALAAFIQTIQADYKGLHGIIHSAGIVKDDFILRKSNETVQEVLSPKVSGATYLDEATKHIPLDFFILFSSIVGPLGNTGQADYAAANGYLDGFAHWRNQQVTLNNRQGQTLAINWPLWKEGGMQLNAEMQNEFRRQMHMELLGTADGLRALYGAIAAGVSQVLVAPGNITELRKKFLKAAAQPAADDIKLPVSKTAALPVAMVPEQKAILYFKELLAGTIKRPVDQIEADAPMEAYGIDSIMVMQLTNQLETVFGSLPKTLFFEYQNIQDLTGYFLSRYGEKLGQLLMPEQSPAVAALNNMVEESSPVTIQAVPEVVNRSVRHQPRIKAKEKARVDNGDAVPLDIAIIGLAGRYPQADNLQEFWNNLANGKDCITEIPADRWDYRLYFDADKEKEGKSYSKWGGFLNDVDKFDPLFFNISPLEAERMDPQERLFLQCVYETIEDAGYTRHSLATDKKFGLGNQVGVFVGVMYEEYQLYGAEEVLQGRPVALWGLPSSIANRVSYFCDFHGPSMAIDTMCSSSLTAIHLACESIVRGNCEVAVAGGVNVSVHPNKYIFLSQGRFASSKGRCESFGIGGDGYVPGEGVGAVLLKPLHKAIADGDHIYGVIKSTAINHGGKTNGYTVPNPKAQAGAIAHAFKGAGINPRAISYIEAHGTGTSLGDPIEIAGLSKAMEEHTPDRQFCAIGSVKSNIGHCESAAGIAGVTKILLQLKHQQIVPSLHSAILNEHIDFTVSPFVVQQGLSPWHRPVIGVNGHAKEYARCAGISSFGAGGANAHLVIEEYIPAERLMLNAERGTRNTATNEPELIVLSALDADRLKEKAKQLLSAIREGDVFWNMANQSLRNMAYTLQVGREQLEHRLAFVVRTVKELEHTLDVFLQGKQKKQPGVYEGIGSGRKTATADTTNDSHVVAWLNDKQYDQVAAWWVRGSVINWNTFYKNGASLQRVSMPVYPFKKERYWIEKPADQPGAFQTGDKQTSTIHPLLHENITDLTGQRFRVTFTGQEFFLKDHLVKGQKVLPAAAYLEMVREAVGQSVRSLAINPFHIQIKKINWQQPVIVTNKEKPIEIELFAEENGDIIFEVYGADIEHATDREVYCQGMAVLQEPHEPASMYATGIAAIQQQCSRVVHNIACYEAFEQIGFQYGHAHRGLSAIHIGNNLLIAKVATAALAFDRKENFVLHPGLLDAALQATLWWNATEANTPLQMYLPVAVESVDVFQAIPAVNWVSISNSPITTVDHNKRVLDIDILTEDGACCVRLKGVTLQAPTAKWLSGSTENNYETWLLLPEWKEKEAVIANAGNPFSKHVVITGGLHTIEKALVAELPGTEVIALEAYRPDGFTSNTLRVFEKVQTLLKTKEKGRILLQVLIPAGEGNMYAGLSGLLKTAHKENPAFVAQVIRIANEETVSAVKQRLHENIGMLTDTAIRYHKGKREVQEWTIPNEQVRQLIELGNRPWKDRGVYLITGGAGGLGFIFAKEIAGNIKNATLVLTGRSAPDKKVQEKIQVLQQAGATVLYKRADVTDHQQVHALVQSIHAEVGTINGIIHSAGVLRDNYIINKSATEWKEVLAPKINGSQYLDDATKEEPLDFFIFFSSVTGAVGNAGQADYATANAFMDEWAAYRNSLVAKGSRHGHTLSINWPLWEEGGMTVDKETTDYLFETMGMVPLPVRDGIDALYRAFVLKQSQVMVIKGDQQRIDKMIVQPEHVTPTKTTEQRTATTTGDQAPEAVLDYFKKLLSSVIRLPVDKIRQDVEMEHYGIDSVMVMKMTGKLEKVFGTLSKTLLFEYQTIQQLAGYFWEEHPEKIQEVCGLQQAAPADITAVQPDTTKGLSELLKAARPAHRTIMPVTTTIQQPAKKAAGTLDIAIIGVAGKYPQADNLQEFWQNLINGKDCVTEIPATRWDLNLYYDADKNKAGKTYSKWGGFINGVDEFDPLFFNISPREAVLLDPQERLFLQCAYQTMEDAGYNRETIAIGEGEAKDRSIGVYVGVMYEEYQLFGLQANEKGDRTALFGIPSSIANRVSYFYNFSGPSMSVDTMCSSSLTAIHLACMAIQNGDCRAAIAGGVNVSIHPNKYLLLAQGKFISGKGRCEAFGMGGEGYVPAEGVGAVLLKPLAQALEDGDHVYGVIKATAINHGGKTNGYTVPNPNAQAAVIKKAYQRAGIDPRTISYMEAHGTGTALGDPIEMTGLKKAFREFTADNRFCAIGSVKSNMGHAESAAGIAGLTKILLQLKHKQLAPSLHSQVLNPNIDFDNSPFIVQQELAEWKRPVIAQNGKMIEGVRRAAISSFGAGGANAHIIIEEAEGQGIEPVQVQPQNTTSTEPVIVLLSAKNVKTGHQLVRQLLDAIQLQQLQDKDLVDLAFTLQTGRDALETRLALVVSSVRELTERLTAFINNEEDTEGIYHGRIERDTSAISLFTDDQELQEAIGKWIERKKYNRLCHVWVKGVAVNWMQLYTSQPVKPKRISLPGYLFAKEKYWAPNGNIAYAPAVAQPNVVVRQPEPVMVQQPQEEPYQLLTYEELWLEQSFSQAMANRRSTNTPAIKRLVCFLSDANRQAQL
ncbi:MAG TPA: SDR family NAD(P)-dependent oxidoreductase, partial [Niastella sp.]